MSQENCPRCGHNKTVSGLALTGVDHWNCGAYREESGNIYESELCEARQELRIQRELAVQFEAGAALLIVRAEKAEAEFNASVEYANSQANIGKEWRAKWNEMKFEKEKAEAELAKRDKVLEQFLVISTGIFAGSMESQGVDISDSMAKERVLKMISIVHERHGLPELAEWLKQGNK